MRPLMKRVTAAGFGLMLSVAPFGFLYGQSAKSAGKKPEGTSVQSITLPQIPAEIPAGPHVETYRKDCLICHSSRYVTMQPRFPQAVWEKEVKKMIDAYGAVIPEADQREIVEYLVAVRGPQESK